MSKVQFTPNKEKSFMEILKENSVKSYELCLDCGEINPDSYHNASHTICKVDVEQRVIEANIKWLTQKRRDTEHLPEKVSYGGLWVLDELIDELRTLSSENKGEKTK